MLNNLPVGGLFGEQLSSSTLQDTLHGAEAGADPWGEVEVLPLYRTSQDRRTQSDSKPVKDRNKIYSSEQSSLMFKQMTH